MDSSPNLRKNFLFSEDDVNHITKLMEDADKEGHLNEYDKKILALIKEDIQYSKAIIDLVGNYLVTAEQGATADFIRVIFERRLDIAMGIDLTKEVEEPQVKLTPQQKKRMN